jgi:hypothetical protein
VEVSFSGAKRWAGCLPMMLFEHGLNAHGLIAQVVFVWAMAPPR